MLMVVLMALSILTDDSHDVKMRLYHDALGRDATDIPGINEGYVASIARKLNVRLGSCPLQQIWDGLSPDRTKAAAILPAGE